MFTCSFKMTRWQKKQDDSVMSRRRKEHEGGAGGGVEHIVQLAVLKENEGVAEKEHYCRPISNTTTIRLRASHGTAQQ